MRAAVAGMGLVLVLTGCSALDGVRRPPPALPPPSPPATVAFEERSAVVPVPAGYRQSTVEFAGASEGAALFTRCAVPHRRVGNHNECSAVWRLVATGWQRLRPQNAPATYRSTAALGGGALAVTSPGQTGLVTLDGRYHVTGWRGRRLAAGAGRRDAVHRRRPARRTLVGLGAGTQRRWVKVVLKNS